MPQSFQNKKELKFLITLGKGSFGSSSNNQVSLEGHRASVTIDKAGGAQLSTLRAQIFGVSQSDMNSVTTLTFKPGDQQSNVVQVYAIDGAQQTLVFSGFIVNAWGNYNSMPEIFLEIQANSGLIPQLQNAAPRSFQGQIDVASVMSQIAQSLGFTFENNGVNVQLSDMYLDNTGMEQVKDLANAAGIDWVLDNTILAIMPKNTPRGGMVPEISDQSGLRGYPTFDGTGVNFETLFNPAITFHGKIKLTTSIPRAAGNWVVSSISHRLESEKPNGAWFSQVRGNSIGVTL